MSSGPDSWLPSVNPYRMRILDLVGSLLRPHLPLARALDFGCGDGWFAHRLQSDGSAKEVVAVDVTRRRHSFTPVELYNGARLPFEDRSFDLTYGIDALHHCDDPREGLKELLRCASRFLLLKDHTYRNAGGKLALAVLDEIGNRRLGVGSVYRYQRDWEWIPQIEAAGFVKEGLVHPAPCHKGLLGWATNDLQFVGLWRRVGL